MRRLNNCLENKKYTNVPILDGKAFDSIVSRNKQKVINIEFVNSRESNQDGDG